MKEYKIELVRGHILINDDCGSKVLIDTGSPLSFHSEGAITLGGVTFNTTTDLMGTDSQYITENVGAKVDGLVGIDILGKGVFIDVPQEQIVIGQTAEGMKLIPSQSIYGYMSAEMDIRGQKAKIIIDTGAPTSYVLPHITTGLPVIDTVKDFNPMLPGGSFESPIYEFPVSFAGQSFNLRAGLLPSLLSASLGLLGVDGVVGMELLKRQPLLIADNSVWISI